MNSSDEGQQLLFAVLGFIRPIIQDLHVVDVNEEKDLLPDYENAGKNLLNALHQFVRSCLRSESATADSINLAAFVDRQPPEPPERRHEESNEGLAIDVSTETNRMDRYTSLVSHPEFQKDIASAINDSIEDSEIWYYLPKRLLAFNPYGTGIQLVDRTQAIERVRRTVYEPAVSLCVDGWESMGEEPQSELLGREQITDAHGKPLIPWVVYGEILQLIRDRARYAILSHTWIRGSPGEVLYGDWDKRTEKGASWSKITKFCHVAATEHQMMFGWVDNVCINKESSAELDEAIRSMYSWYRKAHVCIVYFADVHQFSEVSQSQWFRRGWTLQELLAPKDVHFYGARWDNVLEYEIPYPDSLLGRELPFFPSPAQTILDWIWKSSGTTEKEVLLFREGKNEKVPISRILGMAWMRDVSVPEDSAYSLMGLLGVSMNVAYGEGADNALYRLLEQLLGRRECVLDIFNRSFQRHSEKLIPNSTYGYTGRSSSYESRGRNAKSILDAWRPIEPIVLTHLGVRVQLLLMPGLKCDSGYNFVDSVNPELGDTVVYRGTATLGVDSYYYSLLDSRISLSSRPTKVITSPGDERERETPAVITMAVLNFSVMNNRVVLLPRVALAIPLFFGQSVPGNVQPGDPAAIVPTMRAPEVRLYAFTRRNIVRRTPDRRIAPIPVRDLARYGGMQIMTMYL